MTSAADRNHVWMDLTTTVRARGVAFNGTTRTELRLAQELSHVLGDDIRYCCYSRNRQLFRPVAIPVASPDATPRSGVRLDATAGAFGRQAERVVRRGIQEALRHIWTRKRLAAPNSAFPQSRPGDAIFLAGETWTRRYDLDVIRSLRAQGRRVAVLCQDVIPVSHPHFFDSAEFVDGFARYFRFMTAEADLIVAISQATASEIRRHALPLGGVVGKLAVVEPGSDFEASVQTKPVLPFALEPNSFVIAVSTIQSRKNFDLLYRLWRRFAEEGLEQMPRLLIVGKRGFGTQDLVWQMVNDPAVAGRIALLDAVTDAELVWLYRNCLFSLYPSLIEGWGLPISESLAAGKLCVASNAYSMPEAGAGLAVHLDPLDFGAWYRKLRELAETPDLVANLNADIARRYRRTSWAQSAARLAPMLQELLTA